MNRIVTDYSQLPKLNPVAPQHEEPCLPPCLPPWRVLLSGLLALGSWLNLAVIERVLGEASSGYFHSSQCGNSYSLVPEVIPHLIVMNLAFWGISTYQFPRYRRWTKLAALLSIISCWSIVGAVCVRM